MKANLDQCEAYVTKTINVLSQDEAARLKEEELSKSQGKLHLSTNIYPNPNYGTFRLEVEGNQQHDIDVRIVDLHKGYKYYQLSGKQQQKHVFNITDNRLPAGVYIAVIETNGQTISKRFVVK
jgi:ferredoxin-fold anticodon binding domain-containing protein